MRILSLLIVLAFICNTYQFWEGGHMLVVQIAKQELQKKDPQLYQKIEQYVTILNPLCDQRSQTFVEAASWADDIKDDSMEFLFGWHFYDKPENIQGLYKIYDIIGEKYNSIQALNDAKQELQTPPKQKINNKYNISFSQAFYMRLLIHIVGDIHQPLHNANMFNSTYQNGDFGGNKETIYLPDNNSMLLHSYYDSITNKQQYDIKRPMDETGIQAFENFGNQFRNEFSREYFGDKINLNINQWVQESYDIAHNVIYPYFYKNNKVNEDFDFQMHQMLREQITLGGYRLADFLSEIFKEEKQNEFAQKLQNLRLGKIQQQ